MPRKKAGNCRANTAATFDSVPSEAHADHNSCMRALVHWFCPRYIMKVDTVVGALTLHVYKKKGERERKMQRDRGCV